jgi:hypothetical protein
MNEPVFPNPNDIAYTDKSREQIMDDAYWIGYQEGYRGMGARGISDYEPQLAYFNGYTQGVKDFKKAEKICKRDFPEDANALAKVMSRAFNHWHETFEE